MTASYGNETGIESKEEKGMAFGLEGIKVIKAAVVLARPMAARLLAD
ncbi:hypothetical protein ACFLTG_01495 [Chloroflexota bacterium]